MADVSQKIVSSRDVQQGRAITFVPRAASGYYVGGYSGGNAPPLNYSIAALESRYTNRFDDTSFSETSGIIDGLSADISGIMAGFSNNVVSTFDTRSFAVSMTGASITGLPSAGIKFVNIKAGSGNVSTVFIGPSGVTADSSADNDGYPLRANDSIEVPINDVSKIWAIASTIPS